MADAQLLQQALPALNAMFLETMDEANSWKTSIKILFSKLKPFSKNLCGYQVIFIGQKIYNFRLQVLDKRRFYCAGYYCNGHHIASIKQGFFKENSRIAHYKPVQLVRGEGVYHKKDVCTLYIKVSYLQTDYCLFSEAEQIATYQFQEMPFGVTVASSLDWEGKCRRYF